MTLSRRTLLGAGIAAGAGLALGGRSYGQAPGQAPAWHVGYRTAPAEGFKPAPMRLVSGKAPAGLSGVLYRNGPAQFRHGSDYASHWFDGDGLVHRISFADGKAVHAGRFVETPKRKAEMAADRFLAPGFGTKGDAAYAVNGPDDVNSANISVLMSGGELLALWEGGSAWRLDPATLESIGPKVWRPDLKGMPFLAHPKVEPDGRVWNLAINGSKAGVYRIGADGTLEDFGLVDMGDAAYVHDWAMTERKLIILVQPWLYTRNTPPFIDGFEWKPENGLKLLIIDKDDLSRRRWSQAPARAFYHTGSAWEDADGTIRLDAAFYPTPVLGSGGGAAEIRGEYVPQGQTAGKLGLVTIPVSGDAALSEISLRGDFPQVDPRRHGLRGAMTALVSGGVPGQPGLTAISVHDWDTGTTDTHAFGAGYLVEEHLMIPKPGGASEKDCWLVGTVINLREQASEVCVFDAAHVNAGPVTVWRAAYAWPLGFHGTWAGRA